jgi:hypothetical protein
LNFGAMVLEQFFGTGGDEITSLPIPWPISVFGGIAAALLGLLIFAKSESSPPVQWKKKQKSPAV